MLVGAFEHGGRRGRYQLLDTLGQFHVRRQRTGTLFTYCDLARLGFKLRREVQRAIERIG
ncbi:hypothetical protein D3C85_1789610 [compost metagenome]